MAGSSQRSHKMPVGSSKCSKTTPTFFFFICMLHQPYEFFFPPSCVVHSSNLALIRLVWTHNISPRPRTTELFYLFWRLNFGLMLSFLIAVLPPSTEHQPARHLAYKQLLLFYCCIAFNSGTERRERPMCLHSAFWNDCLCNFLV